MPGGDGEAAALRRGRPPVVARVAAGRVVLDLRAVFPEQDRTLGAAAAAALTAGR